MAVHVVLLESSTALHGAAMTKFRLSIRCKLGFPDEVYTKQFVSQSEAEDEIANALAAMPPDTLWIIDHFTVEPVR